ncbi:MAG: 16S rRNA (guanine(527)-N(7))-methyltransferase RsmG [Bacteroidota bacterium]
MLEQALQATPDVDLIYNYFPELNNKAKERFKKLFETYFFWNNQINVVSRKDFQFFYERHVLHSLGIAKVIQFKKGTTVLDVGTGGGFPGIPLAIMFPECEFVLVDSIGKKIKVVNEVAAALGLKNVKGIHSRAEEINQQFDFVISRAVTQFNDFYPWVKGKFLKKSQNDLANGILYLKGGDLIEEMKNFSQKVTYFDLSNYFSEEFFETKKVVYIPC